ncbi:MAG: NAD(P)H-dependent oxidoreductase [Verrucomicrobiia bacterium]
MKAFCVLGSPRQKGNTAKVLGWIEDELRSGDYAVVRLNLGNGVLAPCRECYACKKVADAPGCSQDDRGNSIFLEMMTADLIVFASPIFCWGVSAQLKALLDRAFCLLKEDERLLLAGKRMALAATGAGAIKDNLDLLVPPYQEFAKYFKCKDLGTLLIPDCTTPDKLNGDVEKRARKFGRSLA